MNDELNAAYRNTEYRVFTPETTLCLLIDKSSPEFTAWCRAQEVRSWAIITAWNPYSQECSSCDNDDANRRLMTLLQAQGYKHLDAEGQSLDYNWPAEKSFFIWNIKTQDAARLGSQFEQHAIVVGTDDTAAELAWLSD